MIAVKAGELVRYDPLTEEVELDINPDELAREDIATVGYLASFEYLNGFRKTIYWSREKMEAHALRYSKGYAAKKGYTFWEKDFDAMAFKTMLRQLISKWGIMSASSSRPLLSRTPSMSPRSTWRPPRSPCLSRKRSRTSLTRLPRKRRR